MDDITWLCVDTKFLFNNQRVANLAKEHSPKCYTRTLPLRVVGIFSLSILCRGLILLRNSKVQRT